MIILKKQNLYKVKKKKLNFYLGDHFKKKLVMF